MRLYRCIVALFFLSFTLPEICKAQSEAFKMSSLSTNGSDLVIHIEVLGRRDSLAIPTNAIFHVLRGSASDINLEAEKDAAVEPKFVRFDYSSEATGDNYSVHAELGKLAVFNNKKTNSIVALPADLVAFTGLSYKNILDPIDRNSSIIGYNSGALVLDFQHSYPIILGIILLLIVLGISAAALILRLKKNHQRTIESRRILFKAREDERHEIASDLHDGPIQALQLLQCSSGMSEGQTKELATRAANQLREVCSELRPPILQHFGFVKAAQSYISDFNILFPHLLLHTVWEENERSLSYDEQLLFYKVLIESLANISKHAEANNIWIRLKQGPRSAQLEIKDDGTGFILPTNMGVLERKGHLGLSFLFQRAESLGCRLQIISKKDKGTSVQLKMISNKTPLWTWKLSKSA